MFSTPASIDITEKTRPLTDAEISLINTTFKTQYTKPLYVWALMAKNSKRRQLFTMLRCAPNANSTNFTKSRSVELKHDPNFVIRSSFYTIDLNKSLGISTFKKKDPRHYRSQIQEDGCFSYGDGDKQKVPRTAVNPTRSLANVYAAQLFVPDFAKSFSSCADGYQEFLKELINYVENKANIYPSSSINGTLIDPRSESRLISTTFKEDHFLMTKNYTKSINPLAKTRSGAMTAMSRYGEEYTREPFKAMKKTRLMPPFENPRAIASFPVIEGHDELAFTQEDASSSIKQSIELGRMNRNVFTSKTVL